jgi:metal-responsive CopG/Arc/MetJ family transcriptional regulator
MSRRLVQIPVSLDLNLLDAIIKNVKGDSRSEKIRLCVQEGYEHLKVKT